MRQMLSLVLVVITTTALVKCDSCGHVFKNATGTFSAPASNGSAVCTYIILAAKEHKVTSFTLTDISLTGNDSLVIYDGANKTENILMNVSATQTPFQGVTFAQNTTFVFNITSNDSESTWTVNYDSEECTKEISSVWAGRVVSPVYLKNRGDFVCTYNLSAPAGVNSNLVLGLQKLELDGKSHLKISSGDQNVTYTNGSEPDDFISPGQEVVEMEATFAKSSSDQSFTVIYKTFTTECTKQLMVPPNKINLRIPPDHPEMFGCEWIVRSNTSNKVILANVTKFDVMDADDVLTVSDGGASTGSRLATLHEDITQGEYIIIGTGEAMTFTFTVGLTYGARAVDIDFQELDFGARLMDSGTLSAGGGKGNKTITVLYQLLSSQPDKLVQLVLHDNNTGNASLMVYDGLQRDPSKLLVSRKSLNTPSVRKITGSDAMLVVLEKFLESDTFSAKFTTIAPGCDAMSTGDSGRFNPMAGSVEPGTCTWTIAPVQGDVVSLTFDALDVGKGANVAVYSGLDQKNIVANFSAAQKGLFVPEIYLNGKDMAQVVLKHTHNNTEYTVDASYKKAEVCSATVGVNSTQQGEMKTPNFPNTYPLNAKCSLNLQESAIVNKTVFISFTDLALVQNHSVQVLKTVNSSQQVMAAYGGNSLPNDLILPGKGDLSIQFSSQRPQGAKVANDVGMGARLKYWILDCGGNITTSNASLVSPGYPEPVTKPTLCVWVVKVPLNGTEKGSTNIIRFNITVKGPAKDVDKYLTVYDGGSIRNPVLKTNASKSKAVDVLSRYNLITVVFNYTAAGNSDAASIGFNFTYNIYNCSKKHQCSNGVCMHPHWRCNQHDDCGDASDEEGCGPTPVPPPAKHSSGEVKSLWVPLCLIFGAVFGAALLFVIPRIIRRFRGNNYSHLRDSNVVVT